MKTTTPKTPAFVHPAYYSPTYRVWLVAQRLIALAMLIMLLPGLLVLSLAVRASSRGPALFSQMRPGRQGKPFRIWKIRTMRVGSDKDARNGLAVTSSHPGVIRIGKVLRDLKIDELPQLWNIVRGEMEFVGPRPIATVLHDKLCREIPNFAMRTSVRPGLTNLGQVTILDNQSQENVVRDWQLRFEAETHYLRHKSAAYDLVLVALTCMFVVKKVVLRLAKLVSLKCKAPGLNLEKATLPA